MNKITRNSSETVIKRIQDDSNFAEDLLGEAGTLFLTGEAKACRVLLRSFVTARFGFEQFSVLTSIPSKSLHRMLSDKGNPGMDNLALIFKTISDRV